MIRLLLIPVCFIFSFNLYSQSTYHLPKVLFITSGADEGRGTVSDGVVLALEAFNRLGVPVRLDNREVLLQPGYLDNFDILIVPTIKSYHDKPRSQSLTYMSDMELDVIERWVKTGGTLITDVNIGRNTLKGKDRMLKDGILNVNNWKLGKCFGVALKEINTAGFTIKDTVTDIWHRDILKANNKEIWRPVVVDYAERVKVLAIWQKEGNSYPALTLSKYGKGKVFLLPSFYILHPLSDGGLSSNKEIYGFYRLVYDTVLENRAHKIRILPWKDAHSSVYCQTFDDGGNAEQYGRIFDFVEKNKLPTIFFVTPHIEKDVIEQMKRQQYIFIQGHSYNHPDFRKLDYFQTENELLSNRRYWNKKFKGFRFPYVSNSFWGMYLLDKLGFEYETSIAANNTDFIRGSIVPYNIPVFNNDFYATLDLLEISQIYRSDWFFYQKVLDNTSYAIEQQKTDAARFENYLKNYFDTVVAPNNGVMVFLGHPMYSAISDITLAPLQNILDYLNKRNVWFASLNEVASRWNKLQKLNVQIKEHNDTVTMYFDAGKNNIDGLTVVLDNHPKKIDTESRFLLKEIGGKYYLIFDLKNEETVKVQF